MGVRECGQQRSPKSAIHPRQTQSRRLIRDNCCWANSLALVNFFFFNIFLYFFISFICDITIFFRFHLSRLQSPGNRRPFFTFSSQPLRLAERYGRESWVKDEAKKKKNAINLIMQEGIVRWKITFLWRKKKSEKKSVAIFFCVSQTQQSSLPVFAVWVSCFDTFSAYWDTIWLRKMSISCSISTLFFLRMKMQ